MMHPQAPKIEFPCDQYPIKVVADTHDELVDFVHSVLVQFDAELKADDFVTSSSRNGRFKSVRVSMRVAKEQHLTELFTLLKANKRIHMVL